jgi:hypothetical protein
MMQQQQQQGWGSRVDQGVWQPSSLPSEYSTSGFMHNRPSLLNRPSLPTMLEDVEPLCGLVPAAAAAAADGFSRAAPNAYSDISSPLQRIEAAQESLLLLQLQLELELQQVQQQQVQQQQSQQQLAAAQAWHVNGSCAGAAAAAAAAVAPLPGCDVPYSVRSAAMSPVMASSPESCRAGRSFMQPVMQQQQPGISAAAAAAFYGSSFSDVLPSIPCSSNRGVLPILDYSNSTGVQVPTGRGSSHSAPLAPVSCATSSSYNALPPVKVCNAGLFTGGMAQPGRAAGSAGSSPRTEAKIQELMAAQQLQLEIQEELLQLLSL